MRSYSGNDIMKKILLHTLLLLAVFTAKSQDFNPDDLLKNRPQANQLVFDFTKTLTADQQSALEQKLEAFEKETSTQIAVVIIPKLGKYEINDYNTKLGRAWGVGGKANNNGAILLIAKDDHLMNIATGYGLEGALPDVTCKQILDEIITPSFKGDDYYAGINLGTDAMMKATKGEYTAPPGYGKSKKLPRGSWIIGFIVVIIILGLFRGGGGGGGSYMSRRGGSGWLIPMLFAGGGGWGGGGGSGGGGGGGFGGFGGGSFGGGGASGSW